MEIELKMVFLNEDGPEQFWRSAWLSSHQHSAPDTLEMEAVYLDTEDEALRGAGIAYRLRRENGLLVASVKSGEKERDGVSERQEWNRVLAEKAQGYPYPDGSLFEEEAAGRDLLERLSGQPLREIVTTVFTRKKVLLSYRDCLLEVVVDTGWIMAAGGQEIIRELEAEWSCDAPGAGCNALNVLHELRRDLSETFSLRPESLSKYARGLRLWEKGRVN